MVKFYMMVGLPASGKSTEAKYISEMENATIHSSDSIRKELYGDENTQGNSEEVFSIIHKRIKRDLNAGINVVFDACNVEYKKRIYFLQQLGKINCEKIAVVIATPYKDCLAQNKLRDRQVPEYVIKKMYLNIFIPQDYEGWDEIRIVYNKEINNTILGLFTNLDKIEQDNLHHTLTIGEHCKKCAKLIDEKSNDDNLFFAGLLHDIGKEFTKVFKNAKGETTTEAHYYQHHLVSAYDSMFYLRHVHGIDFMDTIAYITWHMQPFFIQMEKTKQKFINLVGQEFYDNLMILHEADKLAK